MINQLVFDAETDSLIDSFKTGAYKTVSKVWCIVALDTSTGHTTSFDPEHIEEGLRFLASAKELVGHNIIDFDFRVFQMLYGWKYTGRVLDTYILSEYLYPERVGGHGLEAWGLRTGCMKPQHEDWSKYSPEMLHRCVEDVKNNWLTYQMLKQEERQPIEGVQLWA